MNLRPFERRAAAHAADTAVALVLDGSGSMCATDTNGGPTRVDYVRCAARALALAAGNDIPTHATRYDGHAQKLWGWNDSRQKRAEGLKLYRSGGGTVAPRGISAGLDALEKRREKRKLLLVFSDGDLDLMDKETWAGILHRVDRAGVDLMIFQQTDEDAGFSDYYRRHGGKVACRILDQHVKLVSTAADGARGMLDTIRKELERERRRLA